MPPFACLNDTALRVDFDNSILQLMTFAAYKVITVVIDKKALKDKYVVWQADPYHYCMECLLERYVLFLIRAGSMGDVLAESRERRDNYRLSKAYKYVRKHGTQLDAIQFQAHLPTEIKLARKKENIAGLQLADLIANPSCRDLICRRNNQQKAVDFGAKVVDILYRRKYRRNSYTGQVAGYGTKWLP
jgi:hypothetical protein